MNRKSILLFLASFLVLILAFHAGVWQSAADTGELIIIANPNVKVKSLEFKEVKNIFLGKKAKWEDGSPITLVILNDSNTHKDFLKKYVKFTPSQFDRYWKVLLYSGRGKYPKTLTAAETLQFVAETEGAIGYVKSGNENVKTLTIK